MKIAFTVCSANYLALAKSLADSLVQHNPDYKFYIALLDTYKNYDTAFFAPHSIIPITEMAFPFFKEMAERYNIFELSCALKPFVTEYFLSLNPTSQVIFYFDSDILVYNHLSEAEQVLKTHSLLLTPHLTQRASDLITINTELNTLQSGIFNAGFFGISRSEESFEFLSWWKERLRYHCKDDISHGLFVDQLWLNHSTVLFKGAFVLYNPGYNLAYWNFSERKLTSEKGTYWVNKEYPLVFFHFSGYDVQQPNAISKHQSLYTFENSSEYKTLFEEYGTLFARNDIYRFSELPVTLGKPIPKKLPREKNFFKRKFKKLFKRNYCL